MADNLKALENLERALGQLESYAALPIATDRDKAGLIQGFEFTFVAFWKLFQKLAPAAGLSATCALLAVLSQRDSTPPASRRGLLMHKLASLTVSLMTFSACGANGAAPAVPETQTASTASPAAQPSARSPGTPTPPLARGASGLPIRNTPDLPKPSGKAEHLRVLDWAGLKGAVSYTFDDSNATQLAHYAEIQALGVPMTFYLQTGKPESLNAIWGQAVADGHELGNHTKSHAQSDDGSDTDAATQFIESTWGVRVWTMAAPYGSGVYTNVAKSRFLINRGVADTLIAVKGKADPFTLPCYVPPTAATALGAFNRKVYAARATGNWQVMLIHGFLGGSDGAYQPVAFDEFAAGVEYAKSFGDVWLDTVVAIGAYWRAQQLFTSITPVTTNAQTSWTWTLPAHFPPGKYLRVVVDGGVLSQGGAPLTWDAHGYYEVALDAGSLVLTPEPSDG